MGEVRRFLVGVFDPAYGRSLTVAVLEPDYDDVARRFVSVEEIDSFILAEEEMSKMPRLFKESTVTIQVAAANEAGQSPWATLIVPVAKKGPGRAAGGGPTRGSQPTKAGKRT
jgi:hypothetical protein